MAQTSCLFRLRPSELQTADEDSRNINTNPDIVPFSFSNSVVAGPGDMAAMPKIAPDPAALPLGHGQWRAVPHHPRDSD